MKDSVSSYIEHLFNEFSYPNQESSPCQGIENVSIIVNKKRWKKRKKKDVFEPAQHPPIAFRLSRLSKPNKHDYVTRHLSMPELSECTRQVPLRKKSGHGNDTKQTKIKQSAFQSKFIANVVSEHRFDNWFLNPFNYPSQTKWKIYRCQLGAVEDSCCCSCNSDAMFEVMKGLYDCYKAKNCDGCDCVLCGYKTAEEKKLAELRKSMTSAAREKILEGKTPEEKEFILKEMAKTRQPLPYGKTPSEKSLINKIRKDLGLPPAPKTLSEKSKMRKAEAAGIITPLEGKTPEQKEEILKAQAEMGLPLPEGRTDSEKALIEKVKKASKKRSLKTALLTPLSGKTPAEKERILRGRAMKGLPLPEAQTPSEKKLIDKVRRDLGLPKDPTTTSMKDKHEQAAKAGLLQPLEGKTPAEKEKTLKGLRSLGIPLPEGRTPSEKALIAKVKASPRSLVAPSEQMRRAKAEGLLTPLAGKTPEQKEKILRGLAMKGLPLPEAASPSEKKLIDKVRVDLGLPKEPETKSLKDKYEQAAKAGLLQPLEGQTPIEKEKTLKGLRDLGIPLPEGRTPSEKALIAKVKASPRSIVAPSEQMRRAKAEGLLTPLAGKTPEQKERILKGLAMKGLPLPEAASPSEKKLIDKVRVDLGLPKEPDTKSMKTKYEQAAKAGLLQPLEGKTPEEKEKTLKGLHDLGIPLPEGRTPSEKALVAKVKSTPRPGSIKTEGIMTPLVGKPPELKEKVLRARAKKGIPLPEGQTPSEKKLIDKVRADLGLPKEPDTKSMKAKHEQAAKAGLLEPLEGKTPAQKEAQLKGLRDMGIPLPEGRTPSEKALIAKVKAAPRSLASPSEQMRRAKAEGLITPLTGKTPAQKEKILRGLAMKGLPLPEGTSSSEKKLIDKVRDDLGLPKEPDTKSMKDKHEKAAKAGLLQPLVGKTPEEKEKILQGQYDLGIPLPEGRTPSEKALVAKIKALPAGSIKTAGIMTPLAGKTPAGKEKVLRARAKKGIPLPEGTTPSEKKLIDKVRADLGLPKEPDTKSMKAKHEVAAKAGLLEPLEGKTPAQKEAQLKGLRDMGIPLPEGRTPSEKALIAKIKEAPRSMVSPSEQWRRAKAEGLITPLIGKTPAQKEKILKGLAMKGLALPIGKTPSEKKLIDKVRDDLGLPKEPDTKSMTDKHEQAAKAGLLQPLMGKTPEEKEKILQGQYDLGIPLPEGRTPSEKALIAKIKTLPAGSIKTAGIMTPLTGKTPAGKEKVLRARAKKGIPLPEGTTPSEKKLIDKVRADLGLPKEPDTKSMKEKHEQAAKAGFLEPLEGKTPAQKEAQLKGLRDMGIPLPEGRTPSEKALIAKVKAAPRSLASPSEQLRRAKAEGLMTPLAGKTPAQKEKILKGLAMKGIPLPEGKSPSEKKLIDKVRDDLGLPKEPDTKSMKDKYEQAAKAGLLQPLVGKTPAEKEKILQGQYDLGIPLPEGRTPSEKALVAKIKASPPAGSIKTAGIMTPLAGKAPALKEKVLRARAKRGIPLPEGTTPSEKKIIDKVRADLGLPKEPDTKSMKAKHEQAAKAGLLEPLEGKTPAQKEAQLKGLRDMGIPLPEGRTPSEKALIAKVKGAPRSMVAPSEQLRRAKAEGLMTPLTGKTPAQKEKILKGLAMKGIPLPEGKSPSEKKLIDKVRDDLGLPKEPDTKSMKDRYDQAAKAGLLQPLVGKSPEEKEKILQGQHDLGIPLPEGRSPSEKALIAKIKASPPAGSIKTAGIMTPLAGKAPALKEKVLRARAKKGIPLPEGTTPSEKKIIDKVRADLGLPKEPDTKSMKAKHEQAAKAGLLEPLEGKTPAQKEAQLKGLRDMGIPLPEGRTPSEKALIAKVKGAPRSMVSPSEQLRRAKAEGLMTPLAGKTPAQKEKILKGLAMKGIPLPEGKSPSEKKLIDKVRDDLGLPKEPDTKSLKNKHEQAAKAGLLQPLVGKTPEEKEKILQGQYDLGIPLPEGRTPSEKALVAKIKALPAGSIKTAGVMTPLAGKTPAGKEKILRARAKKGIPLPEGTTPSEKKIIDKVRADLGLPKEPDTKSMKAKHEQAAKAGLLEPLEGKTPAQKEAQLKGLRDMGIPLPEGRTPSEKALIAKVKGAPRSMVSPSEQLRRAKAEGLMTPLAGKTPAQKEKILKGLAMKGIPLPEGKSPSEKKIIDKVRDDLGLPKEPDTKSMKAKYEQAAKAGLLQPLVGKTPEEKEKILQGQHDLGIPLPEGRTPSEKALVAKIKASPPAGSIKTAGIMTPLLGKAPALKEKVLRARAKKGIPLPEGTTPSEKKIIDKVRADLGLPKEPDTKSMKAKHEQAAKAGLLEPLEGKTPAQKEAQLKGLRDMGIPLPEGRTPSEKALIAKVKGAPRSMVSPSEQLRRAKAEGLMTPLAGKTPAQKEKILKGLAMKGIPLPEGKSPSEKEIIDKVRDDLGLPKEPDTKSMKVKHEQAAKAGLLQPLLGKTPEEKENILQGQYDLGIPLPEGRTPSEKALVAKIKALPAGSIKTAGVMTPLAGKTSAGKEKILRARAKKGIPLPEGTTPSEKKIIDKVRADLGLPKEPDTKSMKAKHEQAAKAGLLEPLEGKTPAQKEAQLKGLRDMGIPLPEGRTPSEKALVAKIKEAPRSMVAPSEQLRRAKAEGLITPLAGKTPAQKEKILKGLAMKGIPLPEGKSPSEKKLIDKVRDDLGLPKEPDTKSMKGKYDLAAKAGLLQPLLGKTPEEKEKILQGQHNFGIPLPEGRTPSEKALIAKVKASPRAAVAPSEQLRRAKAEGLLTPLTGKTPEEKEKIIKGLAMKGLPLPEPRTPSEKKLVNKIRADLGLPKEPTSKALRDRHEQAAKAGLLQPLEGMTPEEKEKTLKGLHDLGIPLPVGRTPSEKALIAKVKASPRATVAPSEQLRRAKAEGLLTPLSDKTPEEKEDIIRGLAMKGLPLPVPRTPSEKKLVNKIRADLGLPKEPTSKALRDRHEQAAKAGLLQPLEGMTPEEKEKTLKGLHDLGIPLPVGRTPSEKALIAKVKASPRATVAPSEQLRRAKAEGLLTPLSDKTPEEKEDIIRGLAMKGLPLPVPRTPSEKKLVNKIRADLGLPKEPTTKALRDKHEQAAKAGLLQPLEGMTPEEKEKTLKGLHDLGIPLPEGRTPSEKSLIAKVKASPRATVAPSEQLRRAKAEGLLTPLTGKTPEEKEDIIRGLAMKGLPLPVPRTPSERKLVNKIRADLGLPKEPTTKALRDKHEQAAKAGLLQPLEGMTPEEKEKTLKGLHDLGIPLPEGRTPSEKSLIAKVKASPRATVAPSEQLRRAKAEGLLTPLTGKTPEEKEDIIRGLAMKGLPLPVPRTPSERKLVNKIRADLGLPKEPTSKALRDRHEQAAKAGLLQPLEGMTPEEKEKTLKGLHDLGIPLPEGRTPSEKSLIAKVKASPRATVAPSEQLRRAKAEGLLTPLTGKTPEEKEDIIRGLAMKGLPLPVPRTPSEKKLVNKIRADLGLPKEPTTKALRDKHEQAAKAGLLQPLEGMTPEEKEKTLTGLQEMGIPLPEGRTPSEKSLIAKVKASTKKTGSVPTVTTEKIRQAKEAGLLTPLAGKTPEQKEKLLQGLAKTGLPLPEGKTPSEKALIKKVKQEFGIPDRTPSEKLRRAKEAGLLTPLDGKTTAQKEKILRGRAAAGLPLPVDKTPSERALIKKIKDETGYVTPSQSERLKKAKAAGLLTPLKGKTPEEKEKIVKALAEAGLPLPEGKTKSEKSMIAKIKARTPPEGKTPSEKSIIGKAKAAGLFTPITGKSPAEKERILKGLADAGLPLPEGKTASEKNLVKKIRAEAGLPPEPTPSEKKGKIIKKAKKVGVSASKKARGIDAEEFEDIIKTTKCDRGCGCDRKKIRFKHSYVKIRVTSPDISSFCDCPNECLPGVKAGAFIDNEGIKVTVGSAVGIPSYSMVCINQVTPDKMVSNTDLSKAQTNYYNDVNILKNSKHKFSSFESGLNNNSNKVNINLNVSSSDISYSTKLYNSHSENNYLHSRIARYQGRTSKSEKILESFKDLQSLEDIYKKPISETKSVSSCETILIIRNDMSLSTSTSNSTGSFSLTSNIYSSITSSSAHYSGYQSTNDLLSINSLDGPSTSDDYIDHPAIRERNASRNIGAVIPQQYTILRMTQLDDKFGNNMMNKNTTDSETKDPFVLFNRIPSKLDVSKIMLKIMARKRFAGASSIFIVVPMSEDEGEEGSSNSVDSMTSMRSSEHHIAANATSVVAPDSAPKTPLRTELGALVCGKGRKFYLQEIPSSIDTETMLQNESEPALRRIEMMKYEFCQNSRPNEIVEVLEKEAQAVRSDITADKPCSKQRNAANVTSRQLTPLFLKGKSVSWFRCKQSTETSDYNIHQCFETSCSTVPPRRRFFHECSQQHQTAKSPSLSDCSPADLKVKRNRPAKVQIPSIESTRHESGTVPKNTGVAWFRSGLCKASISSSLPECNVPVCTDVSSSLVRFNSRDHGRNQQHQTPASTASWVCLSDLERTRNPSAKVGKSWFVLPGVRNAFVACDVPPSCDFRFCPVPPKYSRHRSRDQQNYSKKYPLNNLKVTRNTPAKAGKSFSWFRLPRTRKTFPACDTSLSSEHSRNDYRGHQNRSKKTQLDDLEVTKNRSAKVQKPSIKSARRVGQTKAKNTGMSVSWFRFLSSCKIPTVADSSTSDPSVVCHQKLPVSRNLCFKEQKPSAEIIDIETTPLISGILKWFSWTRISSKRKKSAPSIPTCGVPQYFDSSSSPLLPDQPRHYCRNQQNQTCTSPPACVSPLAELKVMRNRSAKVQKPSIQSIYQDGETTWQVPGVKLNGPCLASKHTSIPSIMMNGVPTYIDSSCSPVPSYIDFSCSPVPLYIDCSCSPVPQNQTNHGRNEQSQSSAAPSLSAYPPDDRKVKRNRSGVSLSWSRIPWLCLPSKRKNSTPSIKTCDVPQYVDSSCSPVLPDQPSHYGCNEQSQTSAITFCACPPDDWKVKRNRSAKVQKPSIESIYHEGETTSNIIGVALSWSRLPSKRKTYVPPITSSGVPRCPRFHGRNEQTQTPKPLHGYPTHDLEVMRHPSAKVQKPHKETGPREDGTAPKKAGIASGWFRLPSMRKAPSKFPNKPKNMESFKESKPEPNTLNLSVSNSEPGDQPMSGQIFQLQQMSAIKQKYSRDICCPFRKQNPTPQPELAKEIVRISDFIDQQPAKSIKEIAPLRQKLVSIKTTEQKGDKSMSANDLKSLKTHTQHPKIERQSKENKPKLNTVTLSQSKPETDNLSISRQIPQPQEMSQIEKKEVRTIYRRPCLEQDQMPQPVLAKEIVKLPNPIDQQPVKLTKEISLVPLKLANTKTVEHTDSEVVCEDKEAEPMIPQDLIQDNPMSIKDLENLKTSKQKQKVTEQLPKPRRKRYPPQLPPALLGQPPVETPEGYLYEGIGPSWQWLDTGEIKKLGSALTHSTLGFKACERKKSQVLDNDIELDFADAIRYFAIINPERFQQLMQEELESQLKAEEDKRKDEKKLEKQMEKARKKSEKDAKKGKKDKTTTTEEVPISDESESDYPQGIKFSFVVKSGPTAIAGVDCSKINRPW